MMNLNNFYDRYIDEYEEIEDDEVFISKKVGCFRKIIQKIENYFRKKFD